jgi:NAD(P)-dependent dehydrogenase (short-subunit alcohol dehydrogenase family)
MEELSPMTDAPSDTAAAYLSALFGSRGRTVLVTGGTRGIGYAIAEGFLRAGARVHITSRKKDACDQAQAALGEHGPCTAVAADIATREGREAVVGHLRSREAALDILVNNAGSLWAESYDDYPEHGWDKTFDLNVRGLFFLTRDLTPLLRVNATPERPATVINIGSIDGEHIPEHEVYAYTASKAAVHHLSRHLAQRLAPEHVTVNVIAPGRYPSKMLKQTWEAKGPEAVLGPIPLHRLARPEDLVGAAIFLSSTAASYITGCVVRVDGGFSTTL